MLMRPRSFATAALVALALVVPSSGAASAASWKSAECPTATVQAAAATKAVKAQKKAKKAKKAKKSKSVHVKFNLGGKFCSVDGSTLVFVVHGGQDKGLRGKTLGVTVAENAVIMRNDAPATLADLQAGDHVRVKGTRVKTTNAEGVAVTTYNVTKVMAEAPEPEPAPEQPAPAA
jgi:hypothetical protein